MPVTVAAVLLVLFAFAVGRDTVANDSDPFADLSEPVYRFLHGLVEWLRVNSTLEDCQSDVSTALKDAALGKRSALKMFDAMGKPGSGILEGGVSFVGFYSECLGSRLTNTTTGKYCLANLDFNEAISQVNESTWMTLYPKMEIGLCLPSSCYRADIRTAIMASASLLHPDVNATLKECHVIHSHKTTDDIVGIVVFTILLSMFVFLALVGTILELTGRFDNKGKSNASLDEQSGSPTASNNIAIIEGQSAATTSCSSEVLCKDKIRKKTVSFSAVLLAFSLKKNSAQILNTSSGKGEIRALHGIRFLSMAWIITGHSFSFAQQWLYFRNLNSMTSTTSDFLSQGIANGTFSVDTFFFLSGFLMAYTMLKKMKKTTENMNILVIYIHRYIRMTPAMMMVIAFSATVLSYMGSGPSWTNATMMYSDWCKDNWWLNALYVHNFVDTTHMCLSHTWYSAVDMQFFLVAPFIIKLCFWHIYAAVGVLTTLFLVTTICPLVYTLIYHFPAIPGGLTPEDVMNQYYPWLYIKPYCRMGPYLVGIALAYFMYRRNFSLSISRKHLIIGWIVAIAVNLAVIYSMGRIYTPNPPTDVESALYSAFARSAWAATIGWITLTCTTGQAGIVNAILSTPIFIPLSRLTYVAYLIHPILMALFYGSREFVFDFSVYWLLYLVLGNMVFTYVASFALSLLFESPIINIEKVLMRR